MLQEVGPFLTPYLLFFKLVLLKFPITCNLKLSHINTAHSKLSEILNTLCSLQIDIRYENLIIFMEKDTGKLFHPRLKM